MLLTFEKKRRLDCRDRESPAVPRTFFPAILPLKRWHHVC
jgi:hypothetical protein